jgi:hypothetical protein
MKIFLDEKNKRIVLNKAKYIDAFANKLKRNSGFDVSGEMDLNAISLSAEAMKSIFKKHPKSNKFWRIHMSASGHSYEYWLNDLPDELNLKQLKKMMKDVNLNESRICIEQYTVWRPK